MKRERQSGTYTKQTGTLGEHIARHYLEGRGFQIIGQNIRIGHFEIDLVARYDNTYHIVEVKLRKHLLSVAEAISISKIRRLLCALAAYADLHNIPLEHIQLDLLLIYYNNTKAHITFHSPLLLDGYDSYYQIPF